MSKSAQTLMVAASLTGLSLASSAGLAQADVLSNRHHLSCTDQSTPVVIPHTTARNVRLGLPADIDASVDIQEIYGWNEDTRLRLRRQGLSVQTEGGGARLTVEPNRHC